MQTQINFQNLGGAPQRNDKRTNKKQTGTREWASQNFNFISECRGQAKSPHKTPKNVTCKLALCLNETSKYILTIKI